MTSSRMEKPFASLPALFTGCTAHVKHRARQRRRALEETEVTGTEAPLSFKAGLGSMHIR